MEYDGKRLMYSIKLELHLETHHIPHKEAYRKLNISKQLFRQLLQGKHEPRAGIIAKVKREFNLDFVPEDFIKLWELK
jgi:hypothetical protein